ncbi:hypothetical protein FM036_30050 [Nostoc sp. HG1]|nr:hypothetical protein [Nostoc sp. HG1]
MFLYLIYELLEYHYCPKASQDRLWMFIHCNYYRRTLAIEQMGTAICLDWYFVEKTGIEDWN